MKKIGLAVVGVLICMFITTFSIPGLYGRWQLEKNTAGCPREIVINKSKYNSGITLEEQMYATFSVFDAKTQEMVHPVYSIYPLERDWYTFNPKEYEDSDGNVQKNLRVSLTFEGRKLIFKEDDEKSVCKYKLIADYEIIGHELFGDVY